MLSFVKKETYTRRKAVLFFILRLSGEVTETCQYYYFYFNVITPEKRPELGERDTDKRSGHHSFTSHLLCRLYALGMTKLNDQAQEEQNRQINFDL